MVIKSKIFIKCNAKEFDSWDFYKNLISNSNLNCIYLVGDYHIWSFTDIERKSVGLEPVINAYQLPIHCGRDIVKSLSDAKTITNKTNKTHLIWGSIHVIDIQKKEYWAQHWSLWNTQCKQVAHAKNVYFDWLRCNCWKLCFLNALRNSKKK